VEGSVIRALKQGDEEARCVERDSIEEHDSTEPFVHPRRKDTFIVVSFAHRLLWEYWLTQVCQKDRAFHQCHDYGEKQLCRHSHLAHHELTVVDNLEHTYLSSLHGSIENLRAYVPYQSQSKQRGSVPGSRT
jgi:hypothetical protein